jgi:hypothetical protein
MRVLMNRQGHAETLVAGHVGNRNAVKAGVFSPAVLAPRVQEIEVGLREHPAGEVIADALRHEVASLYALSEAMDASLAHEGIRGRHGDVRTLVTLRLRLNEKLRRTLEHYERVVGDAEGDKEAEQELHATPHEYELTTAPAAEAQGSSDSAGVDGLAERIASEHGVQTLADLAPADFDPETFLRCAIVARDRSIEDADRHRARRLLTRREKSQPTMCTCFARKKARDELQMRDWIDAFREAGVTADAADPRVAATVRQLARGEKLEPWGAYKRTDAAIDAVRQHVARAPGGSDSGGRETRERDPAVHIFWDALLAPAEDVRPKDRLDAFVRLDELGVLPRCTCRRTDEPRLAEERGDAARAYVIRLVAQKYYRAAGVIAQFPETYLAVRDIVDEHLTEVMDDTPYEGRTRPL